MPASIRYDESMTRSREGAVVGFETKSFYPRHEALKKLTAQVQETTVWGARVQQAIEESEKIGDGIQTIDLDVCSYSLKRTHDTLAVHLQKIETLQTLAESSACAEACNKLTLDRLINDAKKDINRAKTLLGIEIPNTGGEVVYPFGKQ